MLRRRDGLTMPAGLGSVGLINDVFIALKGQSSHKEVTQAYRRQVLKYSMKLVYLNDQRSLRCWVMGSISSG